MTMSSSSNFVSTSADEAGDGHRAKRARQSPEVGAEASNGGGAGGGVEDDDDAGYQCMALLKHPLSGSRGDRCKIKKELDQHGFCPYHGNRVDPKWAKYRVAGRPPAYRPPRDSAIVQAEDAAKMEKRKAAANTKAEKGEAIRVAVEQLLPERCKEASRSALFRALAADLLAAPSKARKGLFPPLAKALAAGWDVATAAMLHLAPEQGYEPMGAVKLMVAPPEVFLDALRLPSLVARARATSASKWEKHFVAQCVETKPGRGALAVGVWNQANLLGNDLKAVHSYSRAKTSTAELADALLAPAPPEASVDPSERFERLAAARTTAMQRFLAVCEKADEYARLEWITSDELRARVKDDQYWMHFVRSPSEHDISALEARNFESLLKSHDGAAHWMVR